MKWFRGAVEGIETKLSAVLVCRLLDEAARLFTPPLYLSYRAIFVSRKPPTRRARSPPCGDGFDSSARLAADNELLVHSRSGW